MSRSLSGAVLPPTTVSAKDIGSVCFKLFYEPLTCSSLDLTRATAGCTGDLVHLLKCSYFIQASANMTRTVSYHIL